MNISLLLAAGVSSPGVYYAYQNSDSVGKAIVMALIVGSVLTWTVMLDKVVALYRAKRLSARFMYLFEDNRRNLATPSLVREGENGRFCDPKSAESVADAMELCRREPEETRRMADNARREAEETYSWAKITAKLAAFYREVANG